MRALSKFVAYVAVVGFTGCGGNEPLPPQDSAFIAANAQRQYYGEFSFEVPGGWSSVTPDRDKTKVMLLLGGSRMANAEGLLKVDVGNPSLPTSSDMAVEFASRMSGTIDSLPVDLDGEMGQRITTTLTGLSQPREVIVVYRGGKAYLIMAAANSGVQVASALEHVRATWKWRE